jgi:hypothetical protein
MLAALAELERRDLLATLRRCVGLIGRNSLFTFVAQYFVYYAGFTLLHPTSSGWWPLWMITSLAVIVTTTALWGEVRGNRWLTVGLRRSVMRRSQPQAIS